MNEIVVSPSILSADFAALGQDVETVQKAGADWIHVDVMDGMFVPNLSIGPGVTAAVRKHTDLVLDVHLMILDPLRYAEAFCKAGADMLTVHYETIESVAEAVKTIHGYGVKAGIAISPDTPAEVLQEAVELADMILVMTVYPGFGGQKFMPRCLEKVRKVREMTNREDLYVQVDGGINPETAREAVAAGADCLVAGSAVFGAPDWAEAIAAIRGTK